MQIRTLEPAEYDRLRDLKAFPGEDWIPSPGRSRVMVVENEAGEIIAFWVVQLVVHVEPIWIKPAARGGILAGLMWRALKALLAREEIRPYWALTNQPEVSGYLQRLGFHKTEFNEVFIGGE